MKNPFRTKRLLSPYHANAIIGMVAHNAIENDCPLAWAEFVPVILVNTSYWYLHLQPYEEAAERIMEDNAARNRGEASSLNVQKELEKAEALSSELLFKWGSGDFGDFEE